MGVLSPLFRVSKCTLYALAGTFWAFAIWGFLSFSFALTPDFVTVVTVFLPEKNPAVWTVD